VGVELTANSAAPIALDPAMVRRMPARLPARGVGDGSGGAASTAPVPIPPSASASWGPVVDVSFTVPQVAPEEVLVRLQSERAALNGGYSHPHAAVDCAFCRRAAAAYR
jgi:hypothetical protein